MLVCKSYKVLYDGCKNPVLSTPKIVTKWKNDYDFGFNIYEPKEWFKFLSQYKTKEGKFLPRYTSCGDPVVYYIYAWGSSSQMRLMTGIQKAIIEFFPGFDKKTGKKRPNTAGMLKEI
jgi:hypothetical protein